MSRQRRDELERRRAEEQAQQQAEAQRLIEEKRRREEEEQRRAEEERAQAMREAALLQKQVNRSPEKLPPVLSNSQGRDRLSSSDCFSVRRSRPKRGPRRSS